MAIDSPCLNWTAAKSGPGYGMFRLDGKPVLVHRVMFCDANGLMLDDIKGLVIRHKCDNPACFNPAHLESGTQADNMRDKVERGRHLASPEVRARMSAAQRARFAARPMSDEQKAKLSESHRGNKHSPETIEKMRAASTGVRHTEETRLKLVKAWEKRRVVKIGAGDD